MAPLVFFKGNKMSKTFYIKSFDDYHLIEDSKNYNSIELGCFPPKRGGWYKDFGLFYKKDSGIPSFEEVKDDLFKKVSLTTFINSNTGKESIITKEEVENRIKDSLREEAERIEKKKKLNELMKEKRKSFEVMDNLDDNVNKLKEILRNNCSKDDLTISRKIFKDIEKDVSLIRYRTSRLNIM